MLELISRFEPENLPNERTHYSNSNYLLLGYILEEIYQKPYKYILKEVVTDVLELNNTMYAEIISIENNEIYSYEYKNNVIEKTAAMNLSVAGGAGSLISTTYDMALFIEGLFDGKLIPKNIVSDMIEPAYDMGRGYFMGKGIIKINKDSSSFYGHGGAVDRFYSELWYEPIEKITIAFCVNGNNDPAYSFLEKIQKSLFGE